MPNLAEIRQQYPQYNDLTDQQLAYGFHTKFYSDMPYAQFAKSIGYADPNLKKYNPSEGKGTLQVGSFDTGVSTPQWLERGLAGAGKFFSDAATGMGQRFNEIAMAKQGIPGQIRDLALAPQRADVAETQQRDAPLMQTGAAKVGNIGAGVLSAVPLMAIPGANTVLGAAMIGGMQGAAQSTTSDTQTLMNTGIGAGLGAAGQYVGDKIGGYAQRKLAERSANAAQTEAQNAVRDSTLQAGQDLGLVVPPSTTNPTLKNQAIESLAGKYATQQSAAKANEKIVETVARSELGLSPTAPLTKQTFQAVRQEAGKAYAAVSGSGRIATDPQYAQELASIAQGPAAILQDFPEANVGASEEIGRLVKSLDKPDFASKSAMAYLKELRKQASGNLSPLAAVDPAKRALGHAQADAAGALEDMVIRHLQSQGKQDLATAFDAARVTIAKSHTIEQALNQGSGKLNPANLAGQLKKGKSLSGDLETVAKFAQAFPKAMTEVKDSGAVSKLTAAIGGGGALMGHPSLLALPAASYATRRAITQPAVNAFLANPSYAPGLLGTGALESLQFASPYTAPMLTRMGLLAQPGQEQPL